REYTIGAPGPRPATAVEPPCETPVMPAVTWTAVIAPWGPIHLAASDRGVVAVKVMAAPDGFVARLERRFGRVGGNRSRLTEIGAGQIEAFLAGDRPGFCA